MRVILATVALLIATAANATCVDGVCVPWLDLPDAVRVGLRIAPKTPAGGAVTVQRLEDGRRWNLTATAAEIAEIRALMLPAGTYQLSVALERHRPVKRDIDVRGGRPFDFGAIALAPMPRIEGEVRRADGKPLAGARVALHPAGGTVTTGSSGTFAIDVDGHWPARVVVTRAGYGTRAISLDPTEGDVKLPPTTMQNGATLRLRVARGTERGPIEVKVGLTGDDPRRLWLATRTIDAGRSTIAFDDLDRGVYRLVLSGRDPLQRLVLSTVIKDERQSIDVPLSGKRVGGAVTFGGEPLRGATLRLDRGNLWSSSVVTDAKGEFSGIAWESADLDGLVDGGGLPSARAVRLRANGGLNIDLPARELRGTIVDDSGQPVRHAHLSLRQDQEELRAFIRGESDDEGRFAFGALDAGHFLLFAEAPGYLRVTPIDVTIAEDQTVVEQRVVVEKAYSRALEIVDRDGRPAAGAAVVCAVNGHIRAVAGTDLEGKATIATPAEASILFIIPREGSLAVQRLQPALDDAALVHRITIPTGDARLDILALAGDAPLPGVSLLMRFNGELFTPEIARELRLWHRSNLRTGDDGRATLTQIPSGYYEFWPYQSEEEAEMLIASSAAGAAPIALHVVRGENQVRVRFDARD